jgi:hypothetical protein
VIELPSVRGKAHFDVAKALTSSQLSKCHREKLFPTRQTTYAPISVVPMNKSIEIVMRNELEDLSKNGLSLVHRPHSRAESSGFVASESTNFQIV